MRNLPRKRAGRAAKSAVALLVSTAAIVAPTAATANGAPTVVQALRADLTGYLGAHGAEEHFSALSVRVTYPDSRPGLAISAGTTGYGGHTAVSDDALWQIGSNTKAFTSVVMLRLEADRRLSIHDRLGKWLPEYPAWRDVSIKQLLSMTSGIPDYTGAAAFGADIQAAPRRTATATQLIGYVKNSPPGPPTYAYSNTNFLLAQLVIERATHDSYFHQVTERILRPLGLRDTCFAPETCPAHVASRLPSGYSLQEGLPALVGRPVPPLALSWAQGAGGLVSSLKDMTTWDRALYQGKALPPAQQRELESLISVTTSRPIRVVTAGDPFGYGLGIAQKTDPATGVTWAYQGGTLGFRVLHLYFPRSGLLIAVAVNSSVDGGSLPDLADTVYRTLSTSHR
ncbi:serine hydrolase domain-containing protein [Actinoplanes sp. NPDC051411]|uniref:serine hydrolase domain-containing protein n=1 Tax=Actinoplanes sp. NPDC051411 TaxID=3155522 RepID=UPI00343FBCCE